MHFYLLMHLFCPTSKVAGGFLGIPPKQRFSKGNTAMLKTISVIALASIVGVGFWYQNQTHTTEISSLQGTIRADNAQISKLQKEVDVLTQPGHREALEVLAPLPEICGKIAFGNLIGDRLCGLALKERASWPSETMRLIVLLEQPENAVKIAKDAVANRCGLIAIGEKKPVGCKSS